MRSAASCNAARGRPCRPGLAPQVCQSRRAPACISPCCRKRPGNKGHDFSSPCGALCRNRHEPRQQRSEQFLLTPSLKKKWGPATCEPLSSATCNSFRWRWLTSSGGANLLDTGAKFFQLWRAVTISFWQRSHEGPSFLLKNPSVGPIRFEICAFTYHFFSRRLHGGAKFFKKNLGHWSL